RHSRGGRGTIGAAHERCHAHPVGHRGLTVLPVAPAEVRWRGIHSSFPWHTSRADVALVHAESLLNGTCAGTIRCCHSAFGRSGYGTACLAPGPYPGLQLSNQREIRLNENGDTQTDGTGPAAAAALPRPHRPGTGRVWGDLWDRALRATSVAQCSSRH